MKFSRTAVLADGSFRVLSNILWCVFVTFDLGFSVFKFC